MAAAAVIFLVAGGINPAQASAAVVVVGDVNRGQELFDLNCASCHMGGKNYIKPQKTLEQDSLNKFLGGADQSTIENFVKTSQQHKNLVFFKMPGGKLTAVDYTDVTSFVSDQAMNNKW
eukprot:CAMPEP_0198142106 /NCGR_PEP_ID=MMETSP1443-20131203/4994_1 /TAXON_ID=186043 /ORGANISM="Entomoneis sp., Strain CCMP2396" /LENGTH=118 /DNA_ID=CAMNT_0043805057 /DNA_START=358 /DNA_END=714 /DNA_ORIENTATION=+